MMSAMKLTHQLRYDAPPDRVYAMLGDPAFREEVCDFQGVLRRCVKVAPDGAGMTVEIDQTQAATGIPSFAQKFVGDRIQIIQHEAWASATLADLFVEIPGKPGSMRGTISIAPDPAGSIQTVAAEVKVSIPLIGGKLERLVGDLFVSALKAENRVGRDYLSR
jgi:hypothetical protein